ncbi:MAG: STAS domain-containing protein [Acidimicrobiales bacterium]
MNEAGSLVKIKLLELPVEIHRRAGEHQEALRRELAFVEHAQAEDAAPARLQALTAELVERYGTLTQPQTDQMTAAIEGGVATIDITYELPVDIVDASAHLAELLDELDRFCLEGELLTLVTPPDLLAYRRWLLGEFVEQVRDGRAPQPWRAPTATGAERPPPSSNTPTSVRIEVADDLDLATAPALRNQLAAHAEGGATHITLDLSACGFLDSTGLSLLVATHHRLVKAGGGLRVEGAEGQVRGILDMAGATEFFDQG